MCPSYWTYCDWAPQRMGRRRAALLSDEEVAEIAEFVEEAAPLMAEKKVAPSSKGNVKTKQGRRKAGKGKNGRPFFCYDREYNVWYPGAVIDDYATYTKYVCTCSSYCDWMPQRMGRRRAALFSDEEVAEIAEFVEEAAPLMAERRSGLPSSKGNVKTKQGKKTTEKGKNGRPLLCYDAEYQPWYPGAVIDHYDTRTSYTCTCRRLRGLVGSEYCY